MKPVFHAFADDGDNGKASPENYAEYGVEDEADEEEGDD